MRSKLEYLFSKAKLKIVSNVEKLIINREILSRSDMTQNILYVNTRRSAATHIDINKTLVLKIFHNNNRTLFKALYQYETSLIYQSVTKKILFQLD